MGLSAAQWPFHPMLAALLGCGLSMALAWATMVDLDRRILPDLITLGLVLAGLGLSVGAGPEAMLDAALGAGIGYLSLWAVSAGYRRFRGREGLGLGDAKLLSAAGAWLGWTELPVVLLAGSVLALAFVVVTMLTGRRWQRDSALAFGPFLAASFWLVWTFGPTSRLLG